MCLILKHHCTHCTQGNIALELERTRHRNWMELDSQLGSTLSCFLISVQMNRFKEGQGNLKSSSCRQGPPLPPQYSQGGEQCLALDTCSAVRCFIQTGWSSLLHRVQEYLMSTSRGTATYVTAVQFSLLCASSHKHFRNKFLTDVLFGHLRILN